VTRLFPGAVIFSGLVFLAGCGTGSDRGDFHAAVAQTKNPLVAQVSFASPCDGQAMVEFGTDTSYGRNTSWYPVSSGSQPINVLVAGMLASTTYHMRAQVQCSGNITASTESSDDFTFTTGALPSNPFPTIKVSRPNPSLASQENPGVELINLIVPNSNIIQSFVTDRDGNPIWYYDVGLNNSPFPIRLLANGDVLLVVARPDTTILREIDLAGNTIREMDIATLGQKMSSAGFDFVPTSYHHELLPLDNGHLLVLTGFIRPFTDLPGYPGTINVMGDGIIDLDQNWNPVWAWNGFDHLDVNRHLSGLPDWTHGNALLYSPNDGNLLFSMRHQSWVIKIDYENGNGNGNVLWRLGYQGDFALAQGDDPSLWFSFQHFPSLISQSGSQTTMAIWDNGDFRVLDSSGNVCSITGSPACFSRGVIFQVDESTRVANLLWADAPGLFSVWGGNINQLANGNVEFDVNGLATAPIPNLASEIQEVTQTNTPQIVWKMDITPMRMDAYRAYRVPSLYPGVTWDK